MGNDDPVKISPRGGKDAMKPAQEPLANKYPSPWGMTRIYSDPALILGDGAMQTAEAGWYAMLWVGFGVMHSGMASQAYKRWLARALGERACWERVMFNLLALLALGGLLTYAHTQFQPQPLFQPAGPWRWLLAGVQLLAAVLMGWALTCYDLPRFGGWRQVQAARRGETLPEEPLLISPFHRWVRHPLYATGLVVIWARPWDEAVWWTNLFATLYLLIGMHFEERRLLGLYGEAYARFKAKVPALLPNPWRRWS